MIEAVNVIGRSYARKPSYGRKEADEKLASSDGRMARAVKRSAYVVRDGFTITMN